ncbi:FG-GAP repeat protein [Gilvimarinus sp. DA14]|uniref:FG-GAP repeat protein n=1 Tax=Gilvimarinus sp. DA14 TaxID=2956798 RepID=UPI0020B69463|nr:FG-GAP repeat protein [Gilvimarinus sp. DA14]UTF61495.1 FG-GAP repeat protein [Gilvimarinus sp. DA14]
MATQISRRTRLWLALSASTMLLSACGSDSDDNSTPPEAQAPDAAQVTAEISTKQVTLSWDDVDGATEYRVYRDLDGSSGYEPISEDITTSEFAYPLAAHLTDWDDVRFQVEACNSAGCTPSEDIYIDGAAIDAIGYLKADTPQDKSAYGFAMAISDDGSTLAVGSPRYDAGNNVDAGAVYLYSKTDSGWSQTGRIDNPASDGGDGDLFGYAVDLSADGSQLLVTAPYEDGGSAGVNSANDDEPIRNSGAAYLFTQSGSAWQQTAYFKASNPDPNDFYGIRATINSDATRVAISAPFEASNAAGVNGDQGNNDIELAGAVYVYQLSDSWAQEAYIKPSFPSWPDSPCFDPMPPGIECDEASPSRFGYGLAFDDSGNTLAIGAPGENSADGQINGNQSDFKAKSAGAAYILRFANNSWQHTAYIKASNPSIDDEFGYALALSGDGNTLAVSAPHEDSNLTGVHPSPIPNDTADLDVPFNEDGEPDSGAAYVFSFDGSDWSQVRYIKAEATDEDDLFGWSVQLNSDGTTLAIGVPREDSEETGISDDWGNSSAPAAGAAYVYQYSDTDNWALSSYLKAINTDANDTFGRTLTLSGNGETLAVAATGEDSSQVDAPANEDGEDSGAIYLY